MITGERVQEKKQKCFIKPNGLRLVVELDDFHYSGRLVIPDRAKVRPTTGTVVRVPASGELDEWLGKRVVFPVFSGTPLHFKNHSAWQILSIEEILGEVELTDEALELTELAPMV